MNIYPFEPFVYLIGWTNHNCFYIGSRYCKTAHPSQLWTSYFTSSKIVKEFRLINGEPDVLAILKTFSSVELCRRYEAKLNKRMNVVEDERFFNKSYGNAKFMCLSHSEETREKIRQYMLKYNPFKGRYHSNETLELLRKQSTERYPLLKDRLIASVKGRIWTDEQKSHRKVLSTGENNGMFGKHHSEETKAKISEKHSGRVAWNKGVPRNKIKCPHCGLMVAQGNATRWHFDNCKSKS